MAPLRLVFMGTAELSCFSLRALLANPSFQLQAVVTQPDRPKGRELRLLPTPVKQIALDSGLPVLQPERARADEFLRELTGYSPDLIAVAAYGQILPPNLLALPRLGCVNVHTSLLPRYRGAAPIQWAIINGDQGTGVTIMKMDAGLDTGDILAQEVTAIRSEDNAETLHDRLAEMGANLLVRAILKLANGEIQPRPQPAEGVSYAPKIRKEDGRVDWTRPAATIWNRVRGLAPWPGAFTCLPGGARPILLKLWQGEVVQMSGTAGEVLHADRHGIVVGCGEDAFRISVLQREGGRRLTAPEFLAGHPLAPGVRLG